MMYFLIKKNVYSLFTTRNQQTDPPGPIGDHRLPLSAINGVYYETQRTYGAIMTPIMHGHGKFFTEGH